jgi:hypothetical protein
MTHCGALGLTFLSATLCGTIAGCTGSQFLGGSGSADGGRDASVVPVDGDDDSPSRPVEEIPPLILEASVIGGVSILPPGGLVTSESGEQASFEVVLVDAPDAVVRIGLESSDPTEGTIQVDEVVFTQDDWNVPQTIVITGQDDEAVDGHQGYNITTLPAESSDPQYSGVDAADIAVANLDDDEVGIRFEPTAGLVTGEDGQQANFTARLSSKPVDDVAVFLTSSNEAEGTLSPAVLTFTMDNWNSPRMLTVTGVNDTDPDGAVDYEVIVTDVISGDDNYDSLDVSTFSVSVRNTDDDSAGVTVVGDGLVVGERGEPAMFTVVLNQQPSDVVLIRVSSSDSTEAAVTPDLLTFTVDNWNAPQEVTVSGVDDDDADGDQVVAIELERALSTDPEYNGIEVDNLSVTVVDDETAGFTVVPLSLEVSEGGAQDVFTVRANTQPSAPVMVGISVNDDGEAQVLPTELVFTAENWETPQTVVVTGVDDQNMDGSQSFVVQTAPAQSEDDAYRGINADDVAGLNLDDETAGVSVVPTSELATSEGGSSAEFVIVLSAAPQGTVSVALESSDESEGTVVPNRVDFDSDNWNEPFTVLVNGVDDAITDGAQPFTIVTELETQDEAFVDLLVSDVSVTNRDDECPAPELVDDFEDQDLVLCPSQGRAGTWTAENLAGGELRLSTPGESRGDSDFVILARGSRGLDTELPVVGNPFLDYPVLSAPFAVSTDMSRASFDARDYAGVRLWARSSPPGKLHVAVVTEATRSADSVQCANGCTGHFSMTLTTGEAWESFLVEFATLTSPNADMAAFDAEHLLGLKLVLESDGDYELALDDLAFEP